MAARIQYGWIVAALLMTGCATGRDEQAAAPADEPESNVEKTAEKAGEIATQPARDLGVADPKIPPVLTKAVADPYQLTGGESCAQMSAEIRQLNEALGPDFLLVGEKKENRAGRVAEAGAQSVVNSLIPFRGLVRELTGAAAAKRRLEDAIDAGYARRGFLRGVESSRGCPTTF